MITTDILLKLWAKKKLDSPIYYPLIYHMLDVATVTQKLWDESLHTSAKNFVSNQLGLSSSEAIKLISFWSGLHDLGKASPGFQCQDETTKEMFQNYGFSILGEKTWHGIITTRLLNDLLKEGLSSGFARKIATTVGGHHGIFPRSEEVNKAQSGSGRWPEAQKDLYDLYSHLLGAQALSAQKTDASPAFCLFLAGLTSTADWIASNEEFFPYEVNHNFEAHSDYSAKQSLQALNRLGFTGWQPSTKILHFQEIFPAIQKTRPLQEETINLAQNLRGHPGIVIIEAPTGEGKTEAAVYLADNWITGLSQKGCYFALPTMATSNQMFGRIKSYLENRYFDERVNLILLHGHAALSAEFGDMSQTFNLSGVSGEKGYDGVSAGVIASEWFTHRKRGLLTPFGVGTVDQILMAALQTRHVFVRLFGLAQKTVIVDELHAYDTYMTVLLERLVEWLAALGSSVVMLSATLPKERRNALLRAYAKGLHLVDKNIPPEVSSVPYPRISWIEADAFKAKSISTSHRSTRTLYLKWVNGKLPVDKQPFELGVKLQESLSGGGCAAVICNTVDQAQKLYLALKPYFTDKATGDGYPELDLIHSRFPFIERCRREERTLLRFSKPDSSITCEDGSERIVQRPRKAVLISTQIIEQSLDLDFDLMVSIMPPIDLLLQRAGRLHRHQRERPEKLKLPTLWISQPELENELPVFDNGTQVIYDYHVLLRSWLSIKDKRTIDIPEEIEDLIEAVYAENRQCPVELAEEVKERWGKSRDKHDKKIENEKSEALERWIKWPGYNGELWRITEEPREEDDPTLHRAHQALTRLTGLTANVICLFGNETKAFLDSSQSESVDFSIRPNLEITKKLLKHSLSISHQGLVEEILDDNKYLIPAAWRESSLLRHHYILFFNELGICSVSKFNIRLDYEIGLVIEESK
jgi:CRISPR-associated endonuclease/helicase Cas3